MVDIITQGDFDISVKRVRHNAAHVRILHPIGLELEFGLTVEEATALKEALEQTLNDR
jgi:hypothetical protein